MKKVLVVALAGLIAGSSGLYAGVASAQPGYMRDSDHDGRSDAREWNRDRDRDGRPDQYDRHDNRRGDRAFRYYGGRYGYNGYQGRWRTGQRYSNWRDQRHVITDYRVYNLPPPRAGYRYYREDNGDVVMAAIASGVIGLIIGGALSDNHDGRYRR